MYDGLQSPGRNDECWCGSGKKYKKCHLDFDERLEELAETGEEVPPRDLLKTPAEIEGIKRSAEVNVGVLDYVAERITPGITTEQIDQWVHDYTVEHGAIPAPLDYEGFPKSVCTSVNEVVCHGIPSPDEVLREGDIVNIDCSTIKDGFFSDSSRMFCIGEVSPEAADLVRVTKEAVQVGLDAINLVESGLDRLCACTVAVLAPAENRVRRIMARDGISRDYARLRISAQPSDGFYREHCSHILENTCAGPAQFRDQARIFFRKMLREIEHI